MYGLGFFCLSCVVRIYSSMCKDDLLLMLDDKGVVFVLLKTLSQTQMKQIFCLLTSKA